MGLNIYLTVGPIPLCYSHHHSLSCIYWLTETFLVSLILFPSCYQLFLLSLGLLPKVIPLPFFLFLNHRFNWSHNPCGWKHFKHYTSKSSKNLNTAMTSLFLSHQMCVHSKKGNILYPSRYVRYIYQDICEYIFLWGFFYINRSTLFIQLSAYFHLLYCGILSKSCTYSSLIMLLNADNIFYLFV